MIKNIKAPKPQIGLTEVKITNRLFLDLLYNLSKYPHTQTSKRFVRQGLFAFEERHVFRTKKAKK